MINAARLYLFVAGLVALYVGGALLWAPVAFEATAGVHTGSEPGLLSELRAQGGGLLMAALFMWFGAARPRFVRPATATASALYLAYGLARLVGMALDGPPGPALTTITVVELGIGAVAVLILRRLGTPRS